MGPTAIAIPTAAPHIPKATARCLASLKVTVTMDNVAGRMKAADTPMSERAAISEDTVCEKVARSEKALKNSRPRAITRRRPQRSPNPPPANMRAANGSE